MAHRGRGIRAPTPLIDMALRHSARLDDPPADALRSATGHRLELLLAGSALVVVILSGARAAVFWPTEAYLNTTAGVWTGLATDLANGVFYRAPLGPDGYGGTRYFPLHFILHAGLMKVIADPVWSGFVMSGTSIALLIGGLYLLLRRVGAQRLVAGSCAALVLASQSTQLALLSIRGDALPAALSVWGLALYTAPTLAWRNLAGAAAFFTLAFASKITAVYGLAAACLWLWLTGRPRHGVYLLVFTVAGMGLVVLGMYVASDGRAFEALVASEAATVALRRFMMAPLQMVRVVRQVPETLVFIELGVAVGIVLVARPETRFSLPVLMLLMVLGPTTAIFSAQGADINHLIDLHALGLVVVGSWLAMHDDGSRNVAVAVLSVAALAASLSLASGLVNRDDEQRRGRFVEALNLVPDRTQPILAENSLLPVVAGQRPYLLDSYMFRILRDDDPSFGERLWRDLRGRRFPAVILERDPHTERGVEWYRSGFFGRGFIDELERHYQEVGRVGERVVYVPKPPPFDE